MPLLSIWTRRPVHGSRGCAQCDLWREQGGSVIWREQEDDTGQDGPSVETGDDTRRLGGAGSSVARWQEVSWAWVGGELGLSTTDQRWPLMRGSACRRGRGRDMCAVEVDAR
jgi:hypothetical protein